MFLRITIFYLLTWVFLILLGGIQQETGIFPPEIGLAQWGPGIAALLMVLIFRKDGHKIVFFSRATPVMRYLYAALIPVAVGLVVLLVNSWIPRETPSTPATYESLWLLILWMPAGALGEELGWRGYLHKKLDMQWRGLFSSLLVGILWMPIHVHFLTEGPVFLFFFALMIVSYSIVIYALVHDTGFDVLLATVFHLAINLSNLLFLDVLYMTSFMMVVGAIWSIIAIICVLVQRDVFLAAKRF